MTNPNNAIGTNGAFGGRTSPNALNDVLSAFPGRGVLSGWGVKTAGVMTLQLGGNGSDRDVAIAMDNLGNKTTVNNITNSPVTVSLPEAPEVGYRVDLIVAYVNNPPQGTTTAIDNPAACGLVVVSGSSAVSNPAEPTETDIRTAITADGASGTTAYYVVLAKATVASARSVVATQGRKIINQEKLDTTSYIYRAPSGGEPSSYYKALPLFPNKTNIVMLNATCTAPIKRYDLVAKLQIGWLKNGVGNYVASQMGAFPYTYTYSALLGLSVQGIIPPDQLNNDWQMQVSTGEHIGSGGITGGPSTGTKVVEASYIIIGV